jgi:hypothetical protein
MARRKPNAILPARMPPGVRGEGHGEVFQRPPAKRSQGLSSTLLAALHRQPLREVRIGTG